RPLCGSPQLLPPDLQKLAPAPKFLKFRSCSEHEQEGTWGGGAQLPITGAVWQANAGSCERMNLNGLSKSSDGKINWVLCQWFSGHTVHTHTFVYVVNE